MYLTLAAGGCDYWRPFNGILLHVYALIVLGQIKDQLQPFILMSKMWEVYVPSSLTSPPKLQFWELSVPFCMWQVVTVHQWCNYVVDLQRNWVEGGDCQLEGWMYVDYREGFIWKVKSILGTTINVEVVLIVGISYTTPVSTFPMKCIVS